ncbi:MAG: hypothetical protein N3F05_02375 [Candidatus Diapherotrites archaeon]|nr:hypothetical protein [Candidatus Diapherotrites archaeon]
MDPKIESVKNKIGGVESSLAIISQSKQKNLSEVNANLNFLVGQLENLRVELDNLDKTIVLGSPLTEYSENVEKLTSIEETINSVESKFELAIEKIAEIRKDQEVLKNLLQEGISEKQVQLLESRIKNIEELQEKLMSSKSTKILVELVEIIDELNHRLKRIEELFKIGKISEAQVTQYSPQYSLPYPQQPVPQQQPSKPVGGLKWIFKR